MLQGISFYKKIKISLSLMGILPFLMAIYLFVQGENFSNTLLLLCSVLVLFSILSGFTLLRSSSDQVQNLVRETTPPASGEHPGPINVQVEGEFKDIASNFNSVIDQLNQAQHEISSKTFQLQGFLGDLSESYKQLEDENRLRESLSRYVGHNLVEKLIETKQGQLLDTQQKNVTVLFADIRSFTALTKTMQPVEVVALLNEYFSVMTDIVFKYDGMLDKFVGDQVMAIFGHISSEKEGAINAVKAAVEMQKASFSLMKKRAEKGERVYQIGIGINTGTAILASVGAKHRQDYTVIGDTVNIAAKFEKHAAGLEIIIGQGTKKHLPQRVNFHEKESLKIKGHNSLLPCYALRPRIKKVT